MEKTVVELFAGVGGFRCGFNHISMQNNIVSENGDWDFVWADQYEPSTKSQAAYECYRYRFGKDSISNKDIAKVDKSKIPNHSVLVGGFPCQDYSVAKTYSKGTTSITGKKGVLWWDIIDTIQSKKPPFVLLENVDRLIHSPYGQKGRDFGIMLKSLSDEGYDIEWRVINAADYGFPQKRRRTYIFAYHKSTDYYKRQREKSVYDILYSDGFFSTVFYLTGDMEKKVEFDLNQYKDLVELSDNFKLNFNNTGICQNGKITTVKTNSLVTNSATLNCILEDDVDKKYILDDFQMERICYYKGKKSNTKERKNGKVTKFREGAIPFPDDKNQPARTIVTAEGTVNRSTHIVEDNKTKLYRFLTPVEVERIQGFPDNWTKIPFKSMSERRRYILMGNALVVGLVGKLGDYLSTIIDKET